MQFSASASDVWPVGKPSFDFGDGGQADGNAVSHVYSAPGSYPVTVTVTDAVGRTATSTGTILVKARNHFTIGKLKRNRKKGTATLTVTIPEPGTLVASGKGIKKATVRAAKGGAVKVPLKAVGQGPQAPEGERQAEGEAEDRLLARRRRHEHPAAQGDAAEEARLTPPPLNRLRRR